MDVDPDDEFILGLLCGITVSCMVWIAMESIFFR